MVVLIAMLTGIADYVALLALFAVNAAMIFLGWLMELLNPPDRARTRWLPFALGCVVGAVAWIAIAVQIGVSADADMRRRASSMRSSSRSSSCSTASR